MEKNLHVILNEFKDELSADEEIYATIASYSATVYHMNLNNSNLFVFNEQPFDDTKKLKICHLYQNSSDQINSIIKISFCKL